MELVFTIAFVVVFLFCGFLIFVEDDGTWGQH